MPDKAQLEEILRSAGLEGDGITACVNTFKQERITPAVLPTLSLDDFRDLGLVMGDRKLLFNHLHSNPPNNSSLPSPSAPPEVVPLCEQHNQPLSGLCIERGFESLICNDCTSVGRHRNHASLDAVEGVKLLRSRLQQWKPSSTIENQLQEQLEMVTFLRKQLVEAEETLTKLQQQHQTQTDTQSTILQSLTQTTNLAPGTETLNALQSLYRLCLDLEVQVVHPAPRFTTVIGRDEPCLVIKQDGYRVEFAGAKNHGDSAAIDKVPIPSGYGIVEWTVYPESNHANASWVGFGVIPASVLPDFSDGAAPHSLFYGWATNGSKWQRSAGGMSSTVVQNRNSMRLSLDCSERTLTLTNLDTDQQEVITGIEFPVHPFVRMTMPNNSLQVITH
eukprot:TRINITY_DN67640_c6_g4_i1.p1 TRINITY_DN67640_c6_g4~~TRINITY_DN67640_c6_g4_i1.p1  ORF type:complete len:390 (-),score=13.45 TRINITY_DN67640_c6_g4_i1:307-1476(-)